MQANTKIIHTLAANISFTEYTYNLFMILDINGAIKVYSFRFMQLPVIVICALFFIFLAML